MNDDIDIIFIEQLIIHLAPQIKYDKALELNDELWVTKEFGGTSTSLSKLLTATYQFYKQLMPFMWRCPFSIKKVTENSKVEYQTYSRVIIFKGTPQCNG